MECPDSASLAGDPVFERLVCALGRCERVLVLSGAGLSTASGIPDYRDANGEWKRPQPVQFQDFIASEIDRRRYWARSFVGWRSFSDAQPTPAHRALADLEHFGPVHQLITQNVDGLHRLAGSRQVIDLHGRLDRVICLDCGASASRVHLQHRLELNNPQWTTVVGRTAPDGDADIDMAFDDAFQVPECEACGGVLKPDVVFFGESVPRQRVATAISQLRSAQMLLVVGSSLMVYSGYRFVRAAREHGIPVLLINHGRTRADGEAKLKVNADVQRVIPALAKRLLGAAQGRAVARFERSPPCTARR